MIAFLLRAVVLVPAILVAIPVHEIGHAAAAYLLGDRSVRYFGYLKLDPRRYLDALGVIAVFALLVGWGKRVPVQPNRISTRRQRVIFALGGPAASLAVAIIVGLILRGAAAAGLGQSLVSVGGVIVLALYAIWFLNLSIFAFQLLPIPGLDGWEVIEALFRSRSPRFFFDMSLRRRDIWLAAVLIQLAVLLFLGVNLLALVMSPFYTPASLISLGQCRGYVIPGFNGLWPCLP